MAAMPNAVQSTSRLLLFFTGAGSCDVEGCSKTATEVCRRCFQAMYCSAECQRLSHDRECSKVEIEHVIWNFTQYVRMKNAACKAQYEALKLNVGPLPPVEEMGGLPSPERGDVQRKEIELLEALVDITAKMDQVWQAVMKAMQELEGVSEVERKETEREREACQQQLLHYRTELEHRRQS